MLVERVAAAIRCVRHRKPQSTRYIHRFSSIFAILHRVWQGDPRNTRYIHRFSSKIAILLNAQHRTPPNTRYIHQFSLRIAILHRVRRRDPQLTRYVFRFSTVFAILWCKVNSAEYFLSNVSRFCWPLFECIAFWREFSRLFPSFQKESFCKSRISIDSRPLVGPASQKPGIAKPSKN